MNKQIRGAKYLAVLVLLCSLVISLSAFTFAPTRVDKANALSAQQHTVATQSNVKMAVNPHCSMSVRWSSTSVTISHGITANYRYSWSCSSIVVNLTWIIDWRDGHSTSYTCYLNCASGSDQESHAYSGTGTYIAKVYWSGSDAIASWMTVHVV
jgi:hypothetical protein